MRVHNHFYINIPKLVGHLLTALHQKPNVAISLSFHSKILPGESWQVSAGSVRSGRRMNKGRSYAAGYVRARITASPNGSVTPTDPSARGSIKGFRVTICGAMRRDKETGEGWG